MLTLTDSHPESLNGRLSGNIDKVVIHGPKDAQASFFDDQQFRIGENWVTVRKTTDDPVEIEIAKNFVSEDQENGEGTYSGKGDGFEFAFSRKEKKGWLDSLEQRIESRIGFDLGGILNAAQSFGVPFVDKIELGAAYFNRSSNNYRVDNVSSIKFGR